MGLQQSICFIFFVLTLFAFFIPTYTVQAAIDFFVEIVIIEAVEFVVHTHLHAFYPFTIFPSGVCLTSMNVCGPSHSTAQLSPVMRWSIFAAVSAISLSRNGCFVTSGCVILPSSINPSFAPRAHSLRLRSQPACAAASLCAPSQSQAS